MNQQRKCELEGGTGSVLSCCSSRASNKNAVESSDGIDSTELWSDWKEIFSRLDQQDGVRDGQILRCLEHIPVCVMLWKKFSIDPIVLFCHSTCL